MAEDGSDRFGPMKPHYTDLERSNSELVRLNKELCDANTALKTGIAKQFEAYNTQNNHFTDLIETLVAAVFKLGQRSRDE